MLNFLIIGGQKTGSTYIHNVLQEHPQVYMPKQEIPYLENPDYYNNGYGKILRLFDNQDHELLFGIKRPNYIYKKEVAERIKKHFPNAKMILSLRNPFDRFLSAYFHYVNMGFMGTYPFTKGAEKIINETLPSRYKRAYEVLDFCLFADGLDYYFDFFDKSKLLILNFDNLLTDKISYIKKIYDFLNIDSNYLPMSINERPQSVLYSIQRLKWLRYRNKFIYSYNEDFTRLEIKNMKNYERQIVKFIEFVDRILISKVYSVQKPKFAFPSSVINTINNDIANVEKLSGLDLSNWKKNY